MNIGDAKITGITLHAVDTETGADLSVKLDVYSITMITHHSWNGSRDTAGLPLPWYEIGATCINPQPVYEGDALRAITEYGPEECIVCGYLKAECRC